MLTRCAGRFSGGLKAVIGVPAFISHTFTYEYHPLQAGYAALLREGLAKTRRRCGRRGNSRKPVPSVMNSEFGGWKI